MSEAQTETAIGRSQGYEDASGNWIRSTSSPYVVETDYVLGWMLWGINGHDALTERWIFNGGMCLKKCFFETYRFSEELDFMLTDPAHIDADFLTGISVDRGTPVPVIC